MKWSGIVIHHSLTKDGATVDWQAIRRYHVSHKHEGRAVTPAEAAQLSARGLRVDPPWRDVGYHFGIELVNGSPEILIGRPLDHFGSHTTQQGMNRKAIGVMFCGNFDVTAPPRELLELAAHRLIVPLMRTFAIPLSALRMHREFAGYKSCPGQHFPWQQFLNIVAARCDVPAEV